MFGRVFSSFGSMFQGKFGKALALILFLLATVFLNNCPWSRAWREVEGSYELWCLEAQEADRIAEARKAKEDREWLMRHGPPDSATGRRAIDDSTVACDVDVSAPSDTGGQSTTVRLLVIRKNNQIQYVPYEVIKTHKSSPLDWRASRE